MSTPTPRTFVQRRDQRPWHQWLDPTLYGSHVDLIEATAPTAIASSHGPLLRQDSIPRAFDRVRALAAARTSRPQARRPSTQ